MEIKSASDTALADTGEIIALLAHLASTPDRRSSRNRTDQAVALQAMHNLFREPDPEIAAEPEAANSEPPALPQIVKMVAAPARATPGVLPVVGSRIKLRYRCGCGACKKCLDNARWDRIFNEKFADPAYYGTMVIRRGSTLAPPR